MSKKDDVKDERSIIKLGQHSRAITIPPDFAVDEKRVVIRYTKEVMMVTPESRDRELVITGRIFKEMDVLKKAIKEEKKLLEELEFYEKLLMANLLDDRIREKIKELRKKIRELRTSYDEAP